jgi:hypothetical protein
MTSYLTEDFWANASPQIRALLGENLGFGANSRFVHIDAERYMRMAMDVRR